MTLKVFRDTVALGVWELDIGWWDFNQIGTPEGKISCKGDQYSHVMHLASHREPICTKTCNLGYLVRENTNIQTNFA